ncbi:MAG: hypothetical protein KDK05_13690 [Candidatus Competibacteraceae bacterium]|nr:hypothetical protein [Candidatus Competibacteraceae bacterium]
MKRNNITSLILLVFAAVLLVGERAAAVDYTTPIPLTQLGPDTYYGQQGGLYPGGANEPPAAYAAELDAVAATLAADNKVVVLTLGMSMQQNATNGFLTAGYASGTTPAGTAVNPNFLMLNGAIGSKQQNWTDPNNSVWNRGTQVLGSVGLNAAAVDVVFYYNAWAGPSSEPFPQHAQTMLASLEVTMGIIRDKYPNAQMILVTNRHYALSPTSKHPEPYAYEEGFSWKWLVENRINCTANCGPVIAWLANQWVPGWASHPEYYIEDGLHLSPGPGGGQWASAELWYEAMSTTSYIAPWYLVGPPPTATPSPTSGPTSTPTATPSPSNTPTMTATPTETAVPTATVPGVTATPSATPFPADTATPVPTTGATMTPTATPDGSPWYCEMAPWRWPCPDLGW